MTNLKTVSFSKFSDFYTLDTTDGFAIFSYTGESFWLPGFGNVVLENTDSFKNSISPKESLRIFSGSFTKETVMVPEYEDYEGGRTIQKTTGNYIPVKVVNFLPTPDEKYYYLFLLDKEDDIHFSKDFDVLLDRLEENPTSSEEYLRYVYASLQKNVPLVMDSNNYVCISPFNTKISF